MLIILGSFFIRSLNTVSNLPWPNLVSFFFRLSACEIQFLVPGFNFPLYSFIYYYLFLFIIIFFLLFKFTHIASRAGRFSVTALILFSKLDDKENGYK